MDKQTILENLQNINWTHMLCGLIMPAFILKLGNLTILTDPVFEKLWTFMVWPFKVYRPSINS